MDELITVVFTKVGNTEQLDDVISSANYLVVHKLEQNNGTVAYVFQGIVAENAYDLFRALLDDAGLEDVNVVISAGNAFQR